MHKYYGDPISVLDRGANSELTLYLNPHTYSWFNDDKIIKAVINCLEKDTVLTILSQVPPGFTTNIDVPGCRLFYQVETKLAITKCSNDMHIIPILLWALCTKPDWFCAEFPENFE